MNLSVPLLCVRGSASAVSYWGSGSCSVGLLSPQIATKSICTQEGRGWAKRPTRLVLICMQLSGATALLLTVPHLNHHQIKQSG